MTGNTRFLQIFVLYLLTISGRQNLRFLMVFDESLKFETCGNADGLFDLILGCLSPMSGHLSIQATLLSVAQYKKHDFQPKVGNPGQLIMDQKIFFTLSATY